MSLFTIVFEEKGLPVELTSDRQIAKVVGSGRLRPETLVRVFDAKGVPIVSRADAVERLRPFFGIAEPEPETPPEREIADTVPDSGEASAPAGADAAVGPAADGTAAPDRAEPARPSDSPLSAPEPDRVAADDVPTRSKGPLIGLALGLAVIFIAALASIGAPDREANSLGGVLELDTPLSSGPPEPAEQELGPVTTQFAVRQIVVRESPTGSAAELGRVGRGESVVGIPVRPRDSDQEWLRLETGSFRGGYIWRRNLSDDPRPELVNVLAETRHLPSDTTLYDRPERSSTALQALPAGTEVIVSGSLPTGWWEVEIRTGGVGYLAPTAFAAPSDGVRRMIALQNDCSYPLEVRLLYDAGGAYEDSDGAYWRVPAGSSILPSHRGARLQAASTDIHYHVTTPSGPWRQQNTRIFDYGGQRYAMTPANSSIDSYGDYVIRFFCSG